MSDIVVDITKRSIKFNFLNKNSRIYTVDEIEPHIKDFLNKVKNSTVYGCFTEDVVDGDIYLSNVSHLVTDVFIKNNKLFVSIKILDTPKGKILQTIVDNNIYFTLSPMSKGIVGDKKFVKIAELTSFTVSVGVQNDMFLSVADIRKLKLEKIYGKNPAHYIKCG